MDDKFWLGIWKTIVTCVTVLLLGIVSCNVHIDYRISKAIDGGADPIMARLALTSTPGVNEIAIALLKKQ